LSNAFGQEEAQAIGSQALAKLFEFPAGNAYFWQHTLQQKTSKRPDEMGLTHVAPIRENNRSRREGRTGFVENKRFRSSFKWKIIDVMAGSRTERR